MSRTASTLTREFELLLPEFRRSDRHIHYFERRGRKLGVLLSAPMVEAVLAHGAAYFDKGAATQLWRDLIGDGTGIRPPLQYQDDIDDGEDLVSWRKFRRRALSQHFSRTRYAAYREGAENLLERLFQAWQGQPERELIGEARELALTNFVACFGTASAGDVLRGASDAIFASRIAVKRAVDSPRLCPYDRNVSPGQRALQLMQSVVRPSLGQVRTRRRTLVTAFEKVADAAGAESDTESLFSSLAKAANGYTSRIPRAMLPSQMQGLFIAGTETMSSALTWVLWHLIRDRQLQERIAAGDDPLLRSCIYESLRLHPPAWSIPRESLRKLRLGEEIVEPGTVLIASPLIQHYRADAYEQPERFMPGRFADAPKPSGSYFPFSLGLRTCPAMNFTVDHVEYLVQRILSAWRLTPVDPATVDLRHWLGLDLGVMPDQRYRFRATPR